MDTCRNGLYTEHGIKGLNGFCAERWRIEPRFAVRVPPSLRSTGAAMGSNCADGIVCLAGLSSGVHRVDFDLAKVDRSMVLENDVVFGTVNANRRHYELAVSALAQADPHWLEAVITRRVPLARWADAMERRPDDVKVLLDFTLIN